VTGAVKDVLILVIEDNPLNLELVRDLLEVTGYHTLAADRAERGIRLAQEHPLNLIIMDLSLPGMDGLSATRKLRARPETANIPILALTASAMRGDERRVLAAGCDSYISKPFDIDIFLREVERLLTRKESNDA